MIPTKHVNNLHQLEIFSIKICKCQSDRQITCIISRIIKIRFTIDINILRKKRDVYFKNTLTH